MVKPTPITDLSKAISKFSTYTILVWPIRLLIIISAVLIPILLGLIIWFYLTHQRQINDLINRAKKIEGMIESNVEKGIKFIKDNINDINPENIENFVNNQLGIPLRTVLIHYYNQTNNAIKSIKLNVSDLDNISFSFNGNTSHIKNIETFIKVQINDILNDVIPEIINTVSDKIKEQIGENNINDIINKKNEMKKLLEDFSKNSDNTLAFLITQYELFYKT
tara:strand:+ start:162 stop:827 length:666 start_codon:yes stop_codon:yes gene_type:complete